MLTIFYEAIIAYFDISYYIVGLRMVQASAALEMVSVCIIC